MTLSPQEELLYLLHAGADDRTAPDILLRNKYGRAAFDDGLIRFGSCTSSTPSEAQWRLGVAQLGELRERMVRGETAASIERDAYEQIRARLRTLLPISDASHRLIFTPSGTDAETVFVLLLRARFDRDITNILVAPREVGAGSLQAAGGLYFSRHTADGRAVNPGDPVSPHLAGVEVRAVEVRDAAGNARDIEDIDQQVKDWVCEATGRGRLCVIHLVAHGKTGVHAPSLACVEEMSARFPQDLIVLVDAAQGRFSRTGMRRALEAGEAFMTTGSKFFGGPSFSGLLVLPRPLFPDSLATVADGLAAYCNNRHLGVESSNFGVPNPGLLIRWWIALHSIERYYAVPGSFRYALLRHFEAAVPALFSDQQRFAIQTKSVPPYEGSRLLESKQTVFTVTPLRDGHPLRAAEVDRLLDGLGRALPHAQSRSLEEYTALQCRFELGQPVPLDHDRHAVRIAIGGENISRLYEASHHSADPAAFAAQALTHQLEALCRKAKLLLDNPHAY